MSDIIFKSMQSLKHKVVFGPTVTKVIVSVQHNTIVGAGNNFQNIAPPYRQHYCRYIMISVRAFSGNAKAEIYFGVGKENHDIRNLHGNLSTDSRHELYNWR